MRKQRFKAGFSNLVLFSPSHISLHLLELFLILHTSFANMLFKNYNNNNSVQPQLTSPSLNRFHRGRVWDRDRSALDLLGSTLRETAESGRGQQRADGEGLPKDVVSAREGSFDLTCQALSSISCARHGPTLRQGAQSLMYLSIRLLPAVGFPGADIRDPSFGGFHSAKGNFLDKRQLWLSNQHSQQLCGRKKAMRSMVKDLGRRLVQLFYQQSILEGWYQAHEYQHHATCLCF